MYFAGRAVVDIFNTFEKANTTNNDAGNEGKTSKSTEITDKYEDVCKQLSENFNPKRSKLFERYIFSQIKQYPEETTLQYVTRLRSASRYCEFNNIDEAIIQSILANGKSGWLTKKIFAQDKDPSLTEVLKFALQYELSNNQSKAIREPSLDQLGTVNYISKEKYKADVNKEYAITRKWKTNNGNCDRCGKNPLHENCPALEAT